VLEERVAAVLEVIKMAEDQPLVFYELDSTDPAAPWTAGLGTFIDTLITMAGGVNFGSEYEGAWIQISIEEILAQDPGGSLQRRPGQPPRSQDGGRTGRTGETDPSRAV
jgi:ABC-type Fe3+-hydroxamate transport system substrate-binding protein